MASRGLSLPLEVLCSPWGRPTVVAERLERPLVTKQVAEFDKVLETAKNKIVVF